jgi:tRNA modification GTPase
MLDRALVAIMPAPHSYTGEDVVEISCHGSAVVLAEVLRLLVREGARLAEPGEFTRRAYLNGRMDLVQAESVALLIGARTERAARLAAREVAGSLSEAIHALREGLLDVVAGLEVALDFPEDEVGLPRTAAESRTLEMTATLRDLELRARQGRVIHDGVAVAIAGAPNVGKSSLLNALTGKNRAIVSPEAGTTRDIVESELVVGGIPVRLLDGAGLGVPRGEIDAEGMRRSRQAVQESDLVIVVLDESRAISHDDRAVLEITAPCTRLVVANKSDLPRAATLEKVDCRCSALTGAGIGEIVARLEDLVGRGGAASGDEGGIVTSLRVVEQIDQARTALERGAAAIRDRLPVEVVLIDLREALRRLDRVVGVDADDALLDRIFSTFCVGK